MSGGVYSGTQPLSVLDACKLELCTVEQKSHLLVTAMNACVVNAAVCGGDEYDSVATLPTSV